MLRKLKVRLKSINNEIFISFPQFKYYYGFINQENKLEHDEIMINLEIYEHEVNLKKKMKNFK